MDPQGFGLSNGVITILALLAGFTAANTDKISIICALVSLLITDPLSDSYSIYVASNEENRFEIHQSVVSHGAWDWEIFVMNNKIYMSVSNAFSQSTGNQESQNSVIYSYDGSTLVTVQEIPTNFHQNHAEKLRN